MGYNTQQRERILGLLKENAGRHLTAEEIESAARREGRPVGKSTVYRYLDRLVDQGAVRKFIAEEGKSACYQYTGADAPCVNHYHLKCSDCGALLHVECEFLDKVGSHVLEHHGFVLNGEKTVLYGLCRDCGAAGRRRAL